MKKYNYFSQHLHMHSCYQPGASMEGHIYHAAQLGMKYIWLTDHDVRMGRKQYQVDGFDFENGLFVTEESGRSEGFQLIEERAANCNVGIDTGNCYSGTQCLKVTAVSENAEWKGGGVSFFSSGKRHCSSLMAGVSLKIAAMLGEGQETRVMFDVRLSQRPPEHECAHLLYVIGDTEGLEAAHTAIIPLERKEGFSEYTLHLSEDVLKQTAVEQNVGGLDNAFDTISILVESKNGTGEAWFDEFSIQVQDNFESVRDVQKTVAREKGALYGVTPFVATEISGAGPHKNCFSTTVPIIPYDKFDYKVSHEDAIAWTKEHGGIFALNHPFEKYKRSVLADADREKCLEEIAAEFIANKAWGATLIEVGYPIGRGGFSLQQHLKLWDMLTEAGIFLAGYGSSDNHSNQSGWYDGNNFAAWIGVPEEEKEPVSEAAFVRAMQQGNMYIGNPVIFGGNVIFETKEGLPMGAVLIADGPLQNQKLKFYCTQLQSGWKLRVISNGTPEREFAVTSDEIGLEILMPSEKLINYVRIELYDKDGMCIMLTNPIHLWRRDLGECMVPEQRT